GTLATSRKVTHPSATLVPTRLTHPDLLWANAPEVVNPNAHLTNRLPRLGSILEPW
ncbi:hypothetical protein KI387_028212, partial [Taxus chinensis]